MRPQSSLGSMTVELQLRLITEIRFAVVGLAARFVRATLGRSLTEPGPGTPPDGIDRRARLVVLW
jgi:hypothetical protein